MILIKEGIYRGKRAAYNGEVIYPNGRHTVFAVVMTGGSHDTWGGIPIELDVRVVEYLLPDAERDIENRTGNFGSLFHSKGENK